ncbi:DUF692 domain-containing protein [Ralstonia pseudosolanacearum]|uniref:Uncharacterized protein n=1 Tax=Ralstonia solanacearum TaxID=305 RepID=A0A0S4TPS4_RALSL|nr:hypothetical protein RSP799_19965 [Ralstonia solanacearum]CUV11996.1 conserved protein of unknown function [Ralstonia solanacearum]
MQTASTPLPVNAGAGLRAPHFPALLQGQARFRWVEVHSENYLYGGPARAALLAARAHQPVSLHGVGLGLGNADGLDVDHARAIAALADAVAPAAVSEHLCFNRSGARVVNDLLPLPYSRESLDLVAANIGRAQDILKRPLLIENIATYIDCRALVDPREAIPEGAFLTALARRTGCGILLDLNNLYVNSVNHGVTVASVLADIDPGCVHEIHLAGYSEEDGLLIDTHSRPVHAPVWALYEAYIAAHGARPTLIEWDAELPPVQVLLQEADRAQAILDRHASAHATEACHAPA